MSLTLGSIADVLTILGFILTVAVFLNVRKIKRGYLFTARVPELIEKLRAKTAELVPLQLTFKESSEQVQLALGEAEGLLESIRRKVDGSARAAVVRALKHVRRFPRTRRHPVFEESTSKFRSAWLCFESTNRI